MHTVDLLEQAIAIAITLGYGVRYEWLGGTSGGACEIAGKKWIFIDLSLNVVEQFDQVVKALGKDPAIHTLHLAGEMASVLHLRRAA